MILRLKHFFSKTSNQGEGEGGSNGPIHSLSLSIAQRTDVGRKRLHNEDSVAHIVPKDPVIMAKKGALFIVADGMGGHAAGEVASEIAVSTVCNSYYQDADEDVSGSLGRAIKSANLLIYQRASESATQQGMGTTCVAAVLRDTTAYVANVGDSRAYLVRNNQMRQVSQDHSWVAEQVRTGSLTLDQARTHAMRNMITRSLGFFPDVEVDVFAEPVYEGDTLVLCTDGLSGMVDDHEMQQIVGQCAPQECVYRLIDRANEQGGIDNITVLVIRISLSFSSM